MTCRCTCRARFKNLSRLRDHIKTTGHEKPKWYDKAAADREVAKRDAPIDEDDSVGNSEPNWVSGCDNCGQLPTVGDLGLCGPCCFGEADTAGGNW